MGRGLKINYLLQIMYLNIVSKWENNVNLINIILIGNQFYLIKSEIILHIAIKKPHKHYVEIKSNRFPTKLKKITLKIGLNMEYLPIRLSLIVSERLVWSLSRFFPELSWFVSWGQLGTSAHERTEISIK